MRKAKKEGNQPSKNNTINVPVRPGNSPKKYEHEEYLGGFRRGCCEGPLFSKKLKSGKSLGDLKEKFLNAVHYEPDIESIRQKSIRETRLRKEILSHSRRKDKQMQQLKNHVEKCDVDNAFLRNKLRDIKEERDRYLKKAERLFYDLKQTRHELEAQTQKQEELQTLLNGQRNMSHTENLWQADKGSRKNKQPQGDENRKGKQAKEVTRLKEELSKNYNEIIRVQLALKSLNKEAEELKEDNKLKADTIEQLNRRAEEVYGELDKIKEDKEIEIRKTKLFERQKEELANKLRQSEEQLSIYRKDTDSLREKREFIERENSELKKEMQRLSQSTKKTEQLQLIVQERDREFANLKKALKTAQEKLDHLRMEKETEKRGFKETIKELQKKIKPPQESLENEFGEMKQIIQREREKSKEEKQTMKKQLERISKQFEDKEKKLKEAVDKAKREKKENEETSKKMSDASMRKYEMMQAKYMQKTKQDNELIEQMEIQMHELAKRQKKFQALAKGLEEKNKKQTEEYSKEKKRLEERVKVVQDELVDVKEKQMEQFEDNNKNQREQSQLSDKVQRLLEEVNSLTIELKKQKEAKNDFVKRCEMEQNIMQRMENEINVARQKIESEILKGNSLGKDLAEKQTAIASLEHHYKTKIAELQEGSTQIQERLEGDIDELSRTCQDMRAQLETKDEQIKRFAEALKQAEESHAGSDVAHEQVGSLRRDLAEKQTAIASLEHHYKTKIAELQEGSTQIQERLEGDIDELRRTCQDLRAQLSVKLQEFSQLTHDFNASMTHEQALSCEISTLKQEIDTLHGIIIRERENLLRNQTSLLDQLESLRSANSLLVQEIQDLRKQRPSSPLFSDKATVQTIESESHPHHSCLTHELTIQKLSKQVEAFEKQEQLTKIDFEKQLQSAHQKISQLQHEISVLSPEMGAVHKDTSYLPQSLVPTSHNLFFEMQSMNSQLSSDLKSARYRISELTAKLHESQKKIQREEGSSIKQDDDNQLDSHMHISLEKLVLPVSLHEELTRSVLESLVMDQLETDSMEPGGFDFDFQV